MTLLTARGKQEIVRRGALVVSDRLPLICDKPVMSRNDHGAFWRSCLNIWCSHAVSFGHSGVVGAVRPQSPTKMMTTPIRIATESVINRKLEMLSLLFAAS